MVLINKMNGKYFLQVFILLTNFIQDFESNVPGCMEGETWYEECKECKCSKNGNFTCQWHSLYCFSEMSSILAEHLGNITIFFSNKRCHYESDKRKTICVKMDYQKDMNGTDCTQDSYFYDNCTFCRCDLSSMKYICRPNDNDSKTSGGICNPEQKVMENICYQCSCTFTRLRFCTLSENCSDRKEKHGNCPVVQSFYPKALQDFCIYERYQECYTDYACPGLKKCCRLVDCFLRCVDPM